MSGRCCRCRKEARIDMKRDMDLVRSILEYTEERPRQFDASEMADSRHSEDEVVYHVRIMSQAGLVNAKIEDDMSGNSWATVYGLTWDGHEFLSVVRNDTVWRKVKTEVADKTGSLSFEVVKSLALATVKGLVMGGGALL